MSACRGCGKEILWAKTESGAKIPLDNSAPVYTIDQDAVTGELFATRYNAAHVSHFSTCPQANQFSASRKRETV